MWCRKGGKRKENPEEKFMEAFVGDFLEVPEFSDKFIEALDFTMKWEGGYVNDPDDPGGETNFGISKRAHPDVDIANLTEEEAMKIYYDDYWQPIKGDELGLKVAKVLFDFSVNSGTKRAVKYLQEIVDAHTDGVMGPRTLAKVNTHGDMGVASELILKRVKFLHKIMKRNETLRKYSHGWMRRTHDLALSI